MKIAVIGGGNIGAAIVRGALRGGYVTAGEIVVSDPLAPLAEVFGGSGVEVVTDNAKAIAGADFIIVAVKPWLMEEVLGGIAGLIERGCQAVVSIAAGVSFEQLARYLEAGGRECPALFRAIPNTAAALGESATFIASQRATDFQIKALRELFASMGKVYEVEEDEMMAVTLLSSSGIAYALKYIDAAVKGGEELGVPRGKGLPIVIQTVRGALALLEANGTQPQEEIDKVTTPNGLTIKGLTIMEREGFSQAVIAGLLGRD